MEPAEDRCGFLDLAGHHEMAYEETAASLQATAQVTRDELNKMIEKTVAEEMEKE